MNSNRSTKRHLSLQPLTKEHHNTLSLCWKIQKALIKNIEPARIKRYADWFYKTELHPHFEIEEKYIFTILGNKNELVKRALEEHRRIKRLFESPVDPSISLRKIEEELENHIRFEERVLFNIIQEIATEKELALISIKHDRIINKEEWNDPFWA